MTREDYEREFDQITVGNYIVHAALALHEMDRSNVELVLAMKIAVVELAKDNARLRALAESALHGGPTMIRLCSHGEACSNESETGTSSGS